MDRWATLRRAVRAAREDRGWSQERLAKEAVVSRTSLSHLETGGTKDPRGETLRKVAGALGWSEAHVNALLRGEMPGAREATGQAMSQARRHLPGAPREVLERYVLKIAEYEQLDDEIREIEAQYGRRGGPPSSRQRGASS